MFVDKVQVSIKAGDGGDGRVSFRRERYVDKGGPDGGDGGNGGNVILVASRNQNTLATFRYQKLLKADAGKPGDKRRKHGRSGPDLRVAVPVGTVVVNEAGETLADLHTDTQEIVIAKGGKGGFGNAHFISSTRQTPRVAEKGEMGEAIQATLELKMIAEVGLVGLPNAGKSTLLATISNAKPEIADYPFTTLTPNLGVVEVDDKTSLLFADIPGLIEGASQGKGLGDEFLRHVERTAILIHLIDVYNDDVSKAYQTIQAELKAYRVDLSQRPQLVVLTKIDGVDQKLLKQKLKELQQVVPKTADILVISAKSRQHVPEMLQATKKLVTRERQRQARKIKQSTDELPIIRLPATDDAWHVEKIDGGFRVTGRKIERFAGRTNFSSPPATQRLRDIMRKMGIMHELTRQGMTVGDKIKIGNHGSIKY